MRVRACLLAAGMAGLAFAAPAYATTYTVSSTADQPPGDGKCAGTVCESLRAAVEAANGTTASDTIQLDATTYGVTLGELAVTHDLTVVGKSAATTVLASGKKTRVFNVQGGKL